jgi:hypothetical protein
MRINLKGREALYREGCELFWVQIIEQKEDDWGIVLTIRVKENKFATVNDELNLDYCKKVNCQEVFTVSGAWEVVGFTDNIFYISYVGVKINFRKCALEAFQRNEKDVLEMWNRAE